MADLTKNTPREYKMVGVEKIVNLPLAASIIIYEGGYVCTNSSGDALNGDNGQTKFIGIAKAKATTADDVNIDVILEGVFKLEVTGVDDDNDIGASVYLAGDDNAYTLSSTSNIKVGIVQEWISGTTCWVFLQSDTLRV